MTMQDNYVYCTMDSCDFTFVSSVCVRSFQWQLKRSIEWPHMSTYIKRSSGVQVLRPGTSFVFPMDSHVDIIFGSQETYRLPQILNPRHKGNFIVRITTRLSEVRSFNDRCDLFLGTLEARNSTVPCSSDVSTTQVVVKWAPSAWRLRAKAALASEGAFYARWLAGTDLEDKVVPHFYGYYGAFYGPSCVILEYCGGKLDGVTPDEMR